MLGRVIELDNIVGNGIFNQVFQAFVLPYHFFNIRTVQVVELPLPEEGDARQGLTVTMKGDSGGDPVTLTLDVAVVQIGANAITVTNGGLAGADHDTTSTAVEQGTPRLQAVLAGRTPTPTPSGVE